MKEHEALKEILKQQLDGAPQGSFGTSESTSLFWIASSIITAARIIAIAIIYHGRDK